jgi:hypothetical protein
MPASKRSSHALLGSGFTLWFTLHTNTPTNILVLPEIVDKEEAYGKLEGLARQKNSFSQIKSVITERNQRILRDEEADKEKIRQQDETHNKSIMIWVIIIIIIVISYCIQMASIYN